MNYHRKHIPPVRRTPGTMNKTEEKYCHLLENMKRSGEIIDYKFEPMKFRLAKDTTYCPDFMVVYENYIEFVEIKGFLRDDARVKFKCAAEMYSIFSWKMIKLNHGTWETIMEG